MTEGPPFPIAYSLLFHRLFSFSPFLRAKKITVPRAHRESKALMEKKRPDIDIVNEVLEDCILAYPVSSFIISLYKQYQQRGSLSKKQLQGLLGKATDAGTISPAKLATLEALIKKMPTRYKSTPPPNLPLYEKDETAGKYIGEILAKYPQHKRVVYLKAKWDNNETLSPAEITDLKRFHSLLK
jgi:hypothetical protein